MKREHLFEAIGEVEDRLIEEAADARRRKTPWKKWLLTAACVALALTLGAPLLTFRGCGSKSATSEMMMHSGTATDSAASEESAEAPVATPESGAGGAGDGIDVTDGPVLALTAANGAGLTVSRRVAFDCAGLAEEETAAVTDVYTVTNHTDKARTETFYYPVVTNLQDMRTPTITVDGAHADTALFAGRFAGNFSEDGRNLDAPPDWTRYAQMLEGGDLDAALATTDRATPVTVWRFTDVAYDSGTAGSGASLAVTFTMPEGTSVLTNGINGYSNRDGRTTFDFFVDSHGRETQHDLIFVGDAPTEYAVQGYSNGGLETEQDDITGSIGAYVTTLEAYLREQTESELRTRAAEELLDDTTLGDSPAERYHWMRLEDLIGDATWATRILYTAFKVTIPAGGSVEITASSEKTGSYQLPLNNGSDRTLRTFDLLTAAGSTLEFTDGSVFLSLPDTLELTEREPGFENGVAAIDFAQPHLSFEVRKTD